MDLRDEQKGNSFDGGTLERILTASQLLGSGEDHGPDPADGDGAVVDVFADLVDHHYFEDRDAAARATTGICGFCASFRKATRLDAVAAATEQFRGAPLATVFDFGYSEVARQMAARRGSPI